MFYIKIVDRNQDKKQTYFLIGDRIVQESKHYNEGEIELLDSRLTETTKSINWFVIGNTVRDGCNYLNQLSIRNNNEWEYYYLLNNTSVYLMNEKGQTIDNIY